MDQRYNSRVSIQTHDAQKRKSITKSLIDKLPLNFDNGFDDSQKLKMINSKQNDSNYYQLKITKFVNEISSSQKHKHPIQYFSGTCKNTRYLNDRPSAKKTPAVSRNSEFRDKGSILRPFVNRSCVLGD